MRSIRLAALLALSSMASAATIRVPADHPTIFQAIQFASDGDTILVSPGVYPEQVDFVGKDIRDPQHRRPRGDHPRRPEGSTRSSGSSVGSRRLRSSTASLCATDTELNPMRAGGIWCNGSDPTISNCIIKFNRGYDTTPQGLAGAGGIGSERGSPTIEGCVVESNSAGVGIYGAGGIGLSRSGYADYGPGAVIRDCLIRLNRGSDITTASNAGPGGIHLAYGVFVIEDCTIIRNVGGDLPVDGGKAGAGGLGCHSAAPQMRRCRFLYNQGGNGFKGCDDGGPGGIRLFSTVTFHPSVPASMVNTVVAWNRAGHGSGHDDGGTGGMLAWWSWVDITNCAFIGNIASYGDAAGGLDIHGSSSSAASDIHGEQHPVLAQRGRRETRPPVRVLWPCADHHPLDDGRRPRVR